MAHSYESLPGVYIHPRAMVESDDIGEGTRVWANAHVLGGAKIGGGCNLGDGVFVEGGAVIGDRCTLKNGVQVWDKVTLEDEVFLGPNATLTNDLRPRVGFSKDPADFPPTLIRRGATIGANATIVCDTTIGIRAFIAAGAVVIRDVPDYALMVGNPARQIGWACECGERLPELEDEKTSCGACARSYHQAVGGLAED